MSLKSGYPLRVMQVHTFYDVYLEQWYRKQPRLTDQSFLSQMRALIRDAFSGIHMLAPYLPCCNTMLVVANCLPAQGVWLHENGEFLANMDDWQHEIVRRQITHFQPDVLHIGDSISFSGPFIASLPFKPSVIVGWRGADVPATTDWTGYDIMLSGLPRLLALAETLGAKKGVMFHPGMPTWIARAVQDIPQDIDVVFSGSLSPTQHVNRLRLLHTVAEGAARHGYSLALHLACDKAYLPEVMRPYLRPPVFGIAMHKALRRGRIVIDDRAYHGVWMPDGTKKMDLGGDDTINMRLFEGTGGGSLVLTEALPGLARYFEPGKEVATYTSHADAVDNILYYLQNPTERQAIADAGKARCLDEHNMTKRAKVFLEIVRGLDVDNSPLNTAHCM